MDIDIEDLQKLLASAIQNMDMQLARTLIVDNKIKPQGVHHTDMLLFIRKATSLNDRPLLQQLFKYWIYSELGGRVLWDMLDNIEVATMLVQVGADLRLRRDSPPKPTFLHVLLESDDPSKLKLAELMINRDSDLSAIDDGGRSVLECALRGGASDDLVPILIRTPTTSICFSRIVVAVAESHRSVELIRSLIVTVSSSDLTKSKKARDAIFALFDSKSCKVDAIEVLLDYDMPLDALDDRGNTVLHRAIQKGDLEVAELFLRRGADPNKKTSEGLSPLWMASTLKESSMVTLLIRYGADLHCRNNDGQLPIHGACRGNSLSNMLLLIRLGVDINVVDNRGGTPLSLISRNNLQNQRTLHAFIMRHLALVASTGTQINTHDLKLIQSASNMQEFFDLSFEELQRMQRIEAAEGIPYYTFLIKNVSRISRLTRNEDFKNIFENQTRLEQLFPYYFCDLRNAYVFAKEYEGLVIAKEQFLNEIVFEICNKSLPDLVIKKIANYLCFREQNNFVLDFHSRTFSKMIWKYRLVNKVLELMAFYVV